MKELYSQSNRSYSLFLTDEVLGRVAAAVLPLVLQVLGDAQTGLVLVGVGGLAGTPEGGGGVDHRLRLGPDPRPLLQEVAGADPEVVVVGEGAWWG